jgi:hypothetical protein
MTQDEIIEMVVQISGCDKPKDDSPALKIFIAFAQLVAAKEREACAKVCDLTMLQNQEAINELDDDEHIAKCFIQGAMTQLVKTAKAIRARGEQA